MTAFVEGAVFLVFPAVMAVAAVSDLTTMTIPNRLSLVLAAAFLAAAAMVGLPLPIIAMHLAAGLLVLVVGIGLFSQGWIGGGDAKLAAAAALWLGFEQLLPFLCIVSIFGGVLTIGILMLRSRMLPAFALRQLWVINLHDRATGIPYGIAIAAGALMVFPETPFLALAAG